MLSLTNVREGIFNAIPMTLKSAVSVGIGTVLSRLLSLTGMTFPIYIGAMIAAAIIRNCLLYTSRCV